MGPREQAGFLREAFDILKTTVQKWLDDKASRLGARRTIMLDEEGRAGAEALIGQFGHSG